MVKKIVGAVLLLVLIGTSAILLINNGQKGDANTVAGTENLTTITGIIGSEKKAFFEDQRVKDVLAENGLAVNVETAGSREIATSVDLSKYNFAFPSSAPAAQKIQEQTNSSTTYSPFYSPMTVATYKPVIKLLETNGIATQSPDGTWNIKIDWYLKLVEEGKKWNELEGAEELYNSPRSVLISSTDIRKSNSAAMYLSMASYVLNGNEVVTNQEQISEIEDKLAKIFLAQGFSESSSDDPFQNYLSQGMGSVPLIMIYEAQFIGESISENSRINDQMVLAYPEPTVFSKHIMIPFDENAEKLGELLSNNPELIRLEAEHGFRTNDVGVFSEVVEEEGLAVRKDIINIADTPSYDVLESMINSISNKYEIEGK